MKSYLCATDTPLGVFANSTEPGNWDFFENLGRNQFKDVTSDLADRRGIPITEADQFFASSKTCSRCGHKKTELTLSDRSYHCTECGLDIDRDLNAALNLCPA